MRIPVLIATAISSALIMTAAFAQPSSNDGSTQVRKRYLPEYTKSGELILPKNFNEWVYVGSPLTPNGLNGGKANFLTWPSAWTDRHIEADRSSAFPVAMFITFACLWLLVGSVTGLISSIQLHAPDWLDQQAWLTFGRLRTVQRIAIVHP